MTDRIRRLELEPTPESIADSIKVDAAGRNDDIVAFIEMLDATDGPYTYFIDAPWGEGKTFFIRSVELIMRATNTPLETDIDIKEEMIAPVVDKLCKVETSFLPLYFNAWESDDYGDPISAIFATLAAQLGQDYLTKVPQLNKAIESILDLAAKAIPAIDGISGLAKAIKPKDLIQAYRCRMNLRSHINEMTSTANLEIADKLVIFIDELDRCRPDYAVRLLEQTKSMFQSENIIVVIAADSVQLANAMAGVYGPGYSSSHFLERFYDRRIGLAPTDSYKLAIGEPFREISYRFDSLTRELLNSSAPTPRDVMRLYPKLNEARMYVNSRDDQYDPFDHMRTQLVARCAFLPVLVFIDRDNPALFREITSGRNSNAIYEYGKAFESFRDTVVEAIQSGRKSSNAESQTEVTDSDMKLYCHDLCVAIYSPSRTSEASISARNRLGITPEFNPAIYKELRFPEMHKG